MASTCAKVYQIPGPQGPAGADGADGTNGTNGADAYTLLNGTLTMPGEGLTVNATVDSTAWMAIGQIVYVQTLGHMQVTTVLSGTQVTLTNLKDTAADEYLTNAVAGTVAPDNSTVTPAGLQGPAGTTPGDALLTANQLSELSAPADAEAARGNLGASAIGDNLFTVTSSSAVTFVRVNADDSVTLRSASDFRTDLGLGTIATQAASAVAITGGTVAGLTSLGTGTLAATGAATFSSTAAFSGAVTFSSTWRLAPSSLQTLGAGDAVSANAGKVRVVGSGGAVTLTSTPSISAGTADGQMLLILGTNSTNTVTFQAASFFAGTTLMLGANTRTLGLGDHLLLSWDATAALWCEIAYVNNS